MQPNKTHIKFSGMAQGIPMYLEIPKDELMAHYVNHIGIQNQSKLIPLSLLSYTKKFVNHLIIQGLKDYHQRNQ
jgi:hypothetical protein